MTARKPAAPKFTFSPVERPKSSRGRKAIAKPGMEALVSNWKSFPVGATIELPDHSGSAEHADVTLDRHHFKKYATVANLRPGVDFTIETDKGRGCPVITRLA